MPAPTKRGIYLEATVYPPRADVLAELTLYSPNGVAMRGNALTNEQGIAGMRFRLRPNDPHGEYLASVLVHYDQIALFDNTSVYN